VTGIGLRTLRARVSLLAAGAVLVVLVVAGAGLVLAQRAALTADLDELLRDQAGASAAAVRNGRPVLPDIGSDDLVVQVLAADGSVIESVPLGRPPLVGDGGVPPDGHVRTVRLPDGEGRLAAQRAGDRTVVVAGGLDDVRDSTAALSRGLALGVPLSAAVLAVLVWWAVGRALRPVEDLRRQVETMSGSDLSRRVVEPAVPREIGRLARTMNAMLARVESATDQQRRFVDDASHELRSPLARMRAELEVDRAHPASADPARTAATLLAETRTMQQLVDDLLLLARGDGAGSADGRRPVDLDRVVEEVAARQRAAGASVDTAGVHAVQVPGSAGELARAVGNLVDNAVRHGRSRTVVTLTEHRDGTAVLTVADDGPGIPQAEAERVFERFFRLDPARSPGDGAGLGLAIARDVAERHGGTLTLARTGPGGRFVLTVPALSPPG
jgi:signal transduction histidine kinase